MTTDPLTPRTEDRFWSKVSYGPSASSMIGQECWPWTGAASDEGYGRFLLNGRNGGYVMAHRYAWEQANGPIPDGLFVLHRCDNPRCVNPWHLFLGTKGDNNRDRAAKGRSAPSKPNAAIPATEPPTPGLTTERVEKALRAVLYGTSLAPTDAIPDLAATLAPRLASRLRGTPDE